MSASLESSWSKRRFGWMIVFVFAAQLGALFLFGEKTFKTALVENEKLRFRFVTTELQENEIFNSLLASDPALFALPGLNDFSGEAWLRNKRANYSPPVWDEPPRLLEMKIDSLGSVFVDHVRANESRGIQITEQVLPQIERVGSIAKKEKPSSFRLEGDLVGRGLLSRPSLPAMSHSEPVADTVVQIAVNVDGMVTAARLLSPRPGESGNLAAAAEKALAVSRALRFRPASVGGVNLSWGKITFRWQTLPVPAAADPGNEFQ